MRKIQIKFDKHTLAIKLKQHFLTNKEYAI